MSRRTAINWREVKKDQLFGHVPETRAVIDDIDRWIRWLQLEIPVAVKVGKFSPEAVRYMANRLDVLIDAAKQRRSEIE